jgi:hypothetical protein
MPESIPHVVVTPATSAGPSPVFRRRVLETARRRAAATQQAKTAQLQARLQPPQPQQVPQKHHLRFRGSTGPSPFLSASPFQTTFKHNPITPGTHFPRRDVDSGRRRSKGRAAAVRRVVIVAIAALVAVLLHGHTFSAGSSITACLGAVHTVPRRPPQQQQQPCPPPGTKSLRNVKRHEANALVISARDGGAHRCGSSLCALHRTTTSARRHGTVSPRSAWQFSEHEQRNVEEHLGYFKADAPYPSDRGNCVPTAELWPLPPSDTPRERKLPAACFAALEPLSGHLPVQTAVKGPNANACARNKRRMLPKRRDAMKEALPLGKTASSTAAVTYGEGEPLPQPWRFVTDVAVRDWHRQISYLPRACPESVASAQRLLFIASGRGYAHAETGITQRRWYQSRYSAFAAATPDPSQLHILDADQDSWHVSPRSSTFPPESTKNTRVFKYRAAAWTREGFISYVRRPWAFRGPAGQLGNGTFVSGPHAVTVNDLSFDETLDEAAATASADYAPRLGAEHHPHAALHATLSTVPTIKPRHLRPNPAQAR